jgi:ABC-type glycerol-3-phosphate transport system substrate-binding protein
MKNISVFQIVVLAFFVFVAIVGIAIFAGFGGLSQNTIPKAVIWGTVSGGVVNEVVRNINANSTIIEVTYVQKDPETFEGDFVNALAEGTGPDAVLISDEMLYTQRNKLKPIPFTVLTERDFENTFIDGAKLFVSKEGILGIPFSVDPLVMYWNKSIFASAGVSRAPLTWDELSRSGRSIIKRSDASTINTALIPFGEYSNVTNAKEIIATLFFQSGNPITQRDPVDDVVRSVMDQTSSGSSAVNSGQSQAEGIIDFYTSFSNPSKELYTWNRSMPNSIDAFLSGKLAMYFGYSSEYGRIQDKNPNLNYDVSQVPQAPDGAPVVFGRMTAFAIVKQSRNFAGALGVISKMTEQAPIKVLTDLTQLPPVRRDMLNQPAKDAAMTVFNRAAIQSKSWLDPSPEGTDAIFLDMIESVTSGRKTIGDSITDARTRMDRLLKK